MLYINTAEKRLLVAVRRIKKWIQPRQTVDLNTTDVRMLGSNGQYMRPATEAQADATKAAKEAVEAPAKKESNPKKKDKAPEKTDKELRKALSDTLKAMTKDELTELGEDKLGVDVKSRDKKDAIIKKLLAEAKKQGYASVLKKVG